MIRSSLTTLTYGVSAVLLAGALAAPAHAETVSAGANSKFTASITQSCTITGTGIAFGNYASTGVNATDALDGQTTLNIKCSAGTAAVTATVQAGAGPNATCNSNDNYRAMKIGTSTTNLLTYKLYSDSERTKEWGCVESNQQLVGPFVSSNVGIDKVLYGRVAPNQYVQPGAYTDTVEFRVVF